MKYKHAGNISARLGMLLALALVCSYIETLIPISFGIPGIKLGLANIVALLTLYLMGIKEAAAVSIARILLAGFLFGNPFAIIYSLAGGLCSLFAMYLLKKWQFHILVVSIAGGICHNLGQLLAAALIVENLNLLYYMSVLFFAGFIAGGLIGIVSREIMMRLPKDDGED